MQLITLTVMINQFMNTLVKLTVQVGYLIEYIDQFKYQLTESIANCKKTLENRYASITQKWMFGIPFKNWPIGKPMVNSNF